MPYGGTTPEQDVKIDHCVASVMAKDPSLDRVSAIRICKSQVLSIGRKSRRKHRA